jgi:TolA-binding protein
VRDRLVEFNKSRPAAERPPAAKRPQAIDPSPAAPVTAASPAPVHPGGPAPRAQLQPKPVASPRRLPREKAKAAVVTRKSFAPVLNEPKVDTRPRFATLMQEGYDLYRGGWYGPAMGRFKAASQLMPSSVTAHLWTGRAGLKAGRTAEARRALEQVIVLAPASEAAREARTLLGVE